MDIETKDDIVMTNFSDPEDQAKVPQFLIFLDRAARAVVLAIRGTLSARDVIVDVSYEEKPFLGGFAHGGILAGAEQVVAMARDVVVASLDTNPGYSLVTCGHSLGNSPTAKLYIGARPLPLPVDGANSIVYPLLLPAGGAIAQCPKHCLSSTIACRWRHCP